MCDDYSCTAGCGAGNPVTSETSTNPDSFIAEGSFERSRSPVIKPIGNNLTHLPANLCQARLLKSLNYTSTYTQVIGKSHVIVM